MNIVETIQEKVIHLPPQAQEEILEHVERIESDTRAKQLTNIRWRCWPRSGSMTFRQILPSATISTLTENWNPAPEKGDKLYANGHL